MNPKISVAIDRSFGPVFYRFHRWAYAKSGGRMMTKAMGLPMVLLTSTGRKTGLPRTAALLSYQVDDYTYAVVASNGGRDNAPAWLFNIEANPEVTLQVKQDKHAAKARVATPDEKASLFPSMTKAYKGWAHYETLTDRPIPVVLVEF